MISLTMKRIVLALTVVVLITFTASAQINSNAVGLRFGGGNFGNGVEMTYQRGFGGNNRLEFDLGWYSNSNYSQWGISGIYHWVWSIEYGFNWYVGPGAQVWAYYNDYYAERNKVYVTEISMGLAVGGQIGIEYDFNYKYENVPILLSLDARPMFNFGSYYSKFCYGLSSSVRYTF